MFSVKVLLLLISIVQLSYAHSTGADEAACGTMTPVHGIPAVPPLPAPAPFTVTTSVSSISPGQQLTVTITRTNTVTSARGIMVQARTPAGAVVGQFLPAAGTRMMACPPAGGTVTHAVVADRASIALTWVPPAGGFAGNVQFHCTIVESYERFWVHVLSGVVGITP